MKATVTALVVPKTAISTLGNFSITREGEVIYRNHRSRLMWEVFLYLLSHRHQSFLPDTILNNIKPHQEYSNPSAVMRNQVYRLRLLFSPGREHLSPAANLQYSRGLYQWKNITGCSIDAEQFEVAVDKGRKHAEKKPDLAIGHYQRAIKLYKGEYLAEFTDSDWLIPLRTHYHNLYLAAVYELAGLLKKQKDYENIHHVCEQALQVDFFDERLHICLIEALLASGFNTQARAHYDKVTAAFYSEMGLKPSAAMKSLYRIMNSETGRFETDPSNIAKNSMARLTRNQGAYFVDPEMFLGFLEYELLQSLRKPEKVFACLLTLTENNFGMPDKTALNKTMDHLQNSIAQNLRRGDLFTRWNDAQYLILLTGIERNQVQTIIDRIKLYFRHAFPDNLLLLSHKIADLNPQPDMLLNKELARLNLPSSG